MTAAIACGPVVRGAYDRRRMSASDEQPGQDIAAARKALRGLLRRGGLANLAELAVRWNVTRQRVSVIAKKSGFPEPVIDRGERWRLFLVAEAEAAHRGAPVRDAAAARRDYELVVEHAGGLVGRTDLRERWCVSSSSTVDEQTRRPGFPKPAIERAGGDLWLLCDVQTWEAEEATRVKPGPRPNRPAR